MEIKEVIATINQMYADGVLKDYAIGGAVGATFYLEPIATLDVDIFVTLEPSLGGIISLGAIYNYLTPHGCTVEGEYIIIAGWPVQFLPPGTPLVEEALNESVLKYVEGLGVRVFTAEHLAAIALQTGRAKDKARLLQFVESGVLDSPRFEAIIVRHALIDAWKKFERQFLGDAP